MRQHSEGPQDDGAPHPGDEPVQRSSESTRTALAMAAPQQTSLAETASAAVAAREKAQVEARFLMAVHRPRNPDNSRTRILQRCKNPAFAAVADYAKPVGGSKKAFGASIRMMEELGRQWQNIDVQSIVIFDDRERRIVRVSATDLETNYSTSIDVIVEKTVERRAPRQGEEILGSRVNSTGDTVYRIVADEDAFLVKQNANVAKARREAIRAVIPGDLVDEARAMCSQTRRNEVKTDPAAARKRIADSFFEIGIMPAQLADLLRKPSLEAVTEAELEVLRTAYTALREGETTWAELLEAEGRPAFVGASGAPAAAPTKGTDSLKQKLDEKAGKNAGKPADAKAALDAHQSPPDKCSECGGTGGKHSPQCAFAD